MQEAHTVLERQRLGTRLGLSQIPSEGTPRAESIPASGGVRAIWVVMNVRHPSDSWLHLLGPAGNYACNRM